MGSYTVEILANGRFEVKCFYFYFGAREPISHEYKMHLRVPIRTMNEVRITKTKPTVGPKSVEFQLP